MKKGLLTISILLLALNSIIAQDFTEYYFKFKIKEKSELNVITQIISIDNVKGFEVFAYANQKELNTFQKLGYKIEFLKKDIPKSLSMATTVAEMSNWDRYPTYEVYRQMMKKFEENYPSICKLDSIGTSVNGRQLYVIKISDNVENEEDEPEFFYTSTMHGDETTGFLLMLRLADSILSNYGLETEITNLVNEIELYINPCANPDGTYAGGNSTVSGAKRYNGNNADINRDFPDPRTGANLPYQPETQAMMDFAEQHNFVMSANFHGGAEVMNYPWDTWYYSDNPHADTDWFEQVCTDYVTTARTVYSNYMTSVTSDGVTHGATWYRIDGGRQDYMNYWQQCREITIELSNSKLLATESLNTYWNYNKQSLINFINESLYGIRGIVTNVKAEPLDAMIWVINHDEINDSSMVFTDPDIGDYHRLIEPGTYDLVASAYGYINDTIKNVNVISEDSQIANFILTHNTNIHTLSGTVLDGINNSPIEDVILELTNIPLSTELTNKNGSYYFNGVVEDTINVLIQKDGFIPIDTNISFISPDTIYNFILYPAKTENFENANFEKFNWQFSGNANWIISNDAYEGEYSAESGNIGDSQSSSMEFTEIITQDGFISFYKKVSSEANYDFLKFYIDDVMKGSWSGGLDWSISQYKITPGEYTFKWVFIKDGNTSIGSDCAWIDLISLPANDTSLYITPLFIYDTLNINEVSEHQLFIKNNGNVANGYTIEESQSWIDVDITNNTIDYNGTDTIILTINSSNLNIGYYTSDIIVSSQNQEVNTIHVKLMIKDTILYEISTNHIIDTLWGGETNDYDIIIKNDGSDTINYSIEIENSSENNWISLNETSGTLSLTEIDTITANVNTSNFGFGNFNCNIIFNEQDQGSDTISVNLFIKDTIATFITPGFISDTLIQKDSTEYSLIIKNIGNKDLSYSLLVEFPIKSESWIELEKENGNIIPESSDTIQIFLNAFYSEPGYYSSQLIVKSQNQNLDTIPVNLMIRDTISSEILTKYIIDTLWGGEKKNYDIIIKNNGSVTMNYSIEIENSSENNWISLNETSGILLLTETDTMTANVNTSNFGFGNFNCNIVFHEQDNDSDTISVNLFIKDTIASFISPDFISDTLIQGDSTKHSLIIKNIGNKDLSYSLLMEFPIKSESWIELEKENGNIIPESSDTIQIFLNAFDIEPEDLICAIIINEPDGDTYDLPVNLHILKLQSSSEVKINTKNIKVYPNPFNDYFEIEFYTHNSEHVNISIYDICGRKLFENNFNPVTNAKNHFVINEDDFKSSKLQNGMYFIQLVFEKEIITRQVLKN